MNTQIIKFSDSSVVHRITGNFKGKVSAWFTDGGILFDAEQILPNGQSRPVKVGGPIWRYVEREGFRKLNLRKKIV